MYQDGVNTLPIIQSVFHPTDFSSGSEVAFFHALKTSLLTGSELSLLHVARNGDSGWSDFPGIRETLERWGSLPKNSPKSAVLDLGISPVKIIAHERDPVVAALNFLKRNPVDLIVLATRQHNGRAGWMHKSVAEPVARKAGQMTLFIPGDSTGFVSGLDGSIRLTRILVPVTDIPQPQPAIEATARLITRFGLPAGMITLLHVTDSNSSMPKVRCYEIEGWEWQKITRNGDVITTIVDTAASADADLIVMSTDGRNGFLDALRGSHSERVLRQCSVPLLTVPEGSSAASFLG